MRGRSGLSGRSGLDGEGMDALARYVTERGVDHALPLQA